MARGKNTPLNQRQRPANGLPPAPDFPDDQHLGIEVRDQDGNLQLTYWQDKNEEYHRDGDRPAVIWSNGSKEWYQHGKRHRLANPAVIHVTGQPQTWIKGKRVS